MNDERCQCDVKHKLTDVLILIMCATLCGIDKIPSESTVSRILNMVNAELLAVCIVNIMRELIGETGNIIAIDGKAICSTDTMKNYPRRPRGDYCICLKANQRQLYDDVKLYFEGILSGEFESEKASVSEKKRERYEVRICYVFKDISWLNGIDEWSGLKSVFVLAIGYGI